MDMEGKEPNSAEIPTADSPSNASPSVLGKFSIKSFFGITTKLENPKPKEENAVLKAFRSLGNKAEEQTNQLEVVEGDNGDLIKQTDTVVDGAKEPKELKEQIKDEQISQEVRLEEDSEITREGDLQHKEDSHVSRGQGKSDDSEKENKELYPQIDNLGGTEALVLQEQKDEKKGVSTKRLKASDICEDAKSEMHLTPDSAPGETDCDRDGMLVRGTLVNISSDSDSDGEDSKQDICQKKTKTSVSKLLSDSQVSLNNDPKQNPELQKTEDTVIIGGERQPELDLNGPENAGTTMDEKGIADESIGESSPSPQTPATDNPNEKPFQLPPIFSGFRVHKKGVSPDDPETVTVKQGDSDLALLKLSQPVQKSKLPNGTLVRKKEVRSPVESKASSKFMEQLSQLLNFDMPKKEETEEEEPLPDPTNDGDPGTPVLEEKPESALEAFKSFFTGASKKTPPIDSLDLEAVKRKQRTEKESLKSIFEKSKSIDTDQTMDRKSVCVFFFFLFCIM